MAIDPGRTLDELTDSVMVAGYGTDLVTEIHDALNLTQREVCGLRRWRFLEEVLANNTWLANTNSVDLSFFTFAQLDAIRFFDSDGSELEVDFLPYEEFRERSQGYGSTATGPPDFWTQRGDTAYVLPKTDKAYTYSLEVVVAPSVMSADADRSIIPGRYSDVLVWGAIGVIALRERDDFMRTRAEDKFTKRLNALITAYSLEQRQSVTHVRRSTHWRDVGGGTRWLGV